MLYSKQRMESSVLHEQEGGVMLTDNDTVHRLPVVQYDCHIHQPPALGLEHRLVADLRAHRDRQSAPSS